MKLSETTLNILKNFSTINQSIWIDTGNIIRTISPQKTIFGKAKVQETFERAFGVYDLNQFLSTLSLFDKPEIEFHEKYMVISDENTKVRYGYVDKNIIMVAPSKDLELPDIVVNFELGKDDFNKCMQAAGVMDLPNICAEVIGGQISVVACDSKNNSANHYNLTIGETESDDNKFTWRTENLRMMPDDYSVEISSKGISHLTRENVEYYIATEI